MELTIIAPHQAIITYGWEVIEWRYEQHEHMHIEVEKLMKYVSINVYSPLEKSYNSTNPISLNTI
jgi:hypothetical protein